MKYVLVLLVVVVAAWVLFGRGRGRGKPQKTATGAADNTTKPGKPTPAGTAQAMVACAHCALHLPQTEAVADAQGRWFCDHAHRLAGPRQPPAA